MYKFSPSVMGLLEECPRCFWLEHNKGLKRPDGIFPSLPSGMDRILKDHFDLFMKKGELPPELKDQKEFKDVKLFDDMDLLNKWRNNRQGIQFQSEKFLLKGAIDALLVHGKKFIVLDYKTRGYPLKEDTHHHYIGQLTFYNYIFRKMDIDTEDFSYLLFYHPDKVVDNVFLFHKDLVKIKIDIKHAEDLLKKAIDLLERPLPKPSDTCNFCKYREAKITTSLLDF